MATGQRRWRLVRASTDAVPARVRRLFMVRQRRRHDVVGRRHLTLAGAAMALVLLAGWLLWGTSLLGVREVRVTGAEIVSAEQVREAAGVGQRTPLLRVRPGNVAEQVATLPAVAAVTVRRSWPDAVVIEVVEREPVAAVQDRGQFQLVDIDGVEFHTVPQAPAGLPVVELTDPDAAAGTAAALSVLQALTPQLRTDLATLTVAGPARIELELASGWTVVWGDEHDSELKARVATALLEQEGEIIDVSAPEVVSVR